MKKLFKFWDIVNYCIISFIFFVCYFILSSIILATWFLGDLLQTVEPALLCSIVAWVFSAKLIKRLVVEDFSK